MENVSIKLVGGLGNYMFQIACAYAYGLKYNKKPIFSINDSVTVHKNIDSYKNNIFKNLELIDIINKTSFVSYQEPGFNYFDIPNFEGDVYLNGYFQSEKYFNEFSEQIKNLFSYSLESINKYDYLKPYTTCSIHVRRGDYLNSPNHHPVQNMNYYMKAIKQMPKDTIFLIFSDDISWCKQNFPDLPEKFKFIEGNTDYEDLQLMSSCNHNIICNSTFSWWAAWLNKNKNKKIIIPSQWFGQAYVNHNTEDLYCDDWIKI